MLYTIKQLKRRFDSFLVAGFSAEMNPDVSKFVDNLDKNDNDKIHWKEVDVQNEELRNVIKGIFGAVKEKEISDFQFVEKEQLQNSLKQQGEEIVGLMRKYNENINAVGEETKSKVKRVRKGVNTPTIADVIAKDQEAMRFKTLQKGSTGENVRALQRALAIQADGKFGPQTERAVKNFQKANNITPADGTVTEALFKSMQIISAENIEPTNAPKEAQTQTEVASTKFQLNNAEKKITNLESFIRGKKPQGINELLTNIYDSDAFTTENVYSENGGYSKTAFDYLVTTLGENGYEFKTTMRKGKELTLVMKALERYAGYKNEGDTDENVRGMAYEGGLFNRVKLISGVRKEERKKLLEAFESKSPKGLNSKLQAIYTQVDKNQKNLTYKQKLHACFDFDINGDTTSTKNYYVKEKIINDFIEKPELLKKFLTIIKYENFETDIKENYFVAREKLISKIFDKFSKEGDLEGVIGTLYKQDGNDLKIYSYGESKKEFNIKIENTINGFQDSVRKQIVEKLEGIRSGVDNANTRTKEGALAFMNPNNNTKTRFEGLKTLSKALKNKQLSKYLNSKDFSLKEQDAIVDYMVVYARTSRQAMNGNIKNIGQNIENLRKMEHSETNRRKVFNELLGVNLTKEANELYDKAKAGAREGKFGATSKFGYFLDPVATLNVESQNLRGLDVLHTSINLLSVKGEPILIPITGAKKEQLFKKLFDKGKLPEGVTKDNIVLYLGKDASGLDDQILVKKVEGGEFKDGLNEQKKVVIENINDGGRGDGNPGDTPGGGVSGSVFSVTGNINTGTNSQEGVGAPGSSGKKTSNSGKNFNK